MTNENQDEPITFQVIKSHGKPELHRIGPIGCIMELETDSGLRRLEFLGTAVEEFRDMFLENTENIRDAEEDTEFNNELAATPLGKAIDVMKSKDKNLLRRALWRLSYEGKETILETYGSDA